MPVLVDTPSAHLFQRLRRTESPCLDVYDNERVREPTRPTRKASIPTLVKQGIINICPQRDAGEVNQNRTIILKRH